MNEVNIGSLAKYILEKLGAMSTMKLQKLCFYSQVWFYYFTNEKLVIEEFQAWANGPVCYELFDLHRGKYIVDSSSLPNHSASELSEEQMRIVDSVLNSYSSFSGADLSNLSHSEYPWISARQDIAPGAISNRVISLQSMKEFAQAKSSSK